MLQQGPFAPRPDTRDLIQRIGADGGTALLAVAPDDKTMGFVAQPLNTIAARNPARTLPQRSFSERFTNAFSPG